MLEDYNDSVNLIAFAPNGSMLASGSYNEKLKVQGATTLEFLARLEGRNRSVKSIAFAPNSTMLASGSSDRTVKL